MIYIYYILYYTYRLYNFTRSYVYCIERRMRLLTARPARTMPRATSSCTPLRSAFCFRFHFFQRAVSYERGTPVNARPT